MPFCQMPFCQMPLVLRPFCQMPFCETLSTFVGIFCRIARGAVAGLSVDSLVPGLSSAAQPAPTLTTTRLAHTHGDFLTDPLIEISIARRVTLTPQKSEGARFESLYFQGGGRVSSHFSCAASWVAPGRRPRSRGMAERLRKWLERVKAALKKLAEERGLLKS
jgi:hypothetical protein